MTINYSKGLLRLFSLLQKVNDNPEKYASECLEIQERLIRKLSHVENRIRVLKDNLRESKRQLAIRRSKTGAREIKDTIQRCHYLIDEYQRLKTILRDIGDGIAFTYIDKWDIKPMVFKQSAGSITRKRGSRLERRLWRWAFKRGGVAILNDLTNCLRYGDVTVPTGTSMIVIEAKSGRGAATRRAIRQSGRADKLFRYLGEDEVTGLYDENTRMIRLAFHSEEKHHRGVLNTGIAHALKHGAWSSQVETGLWYVVDTADNLKPSELFAAQPGREIVAFFVNGWKGSVRGYYPFPLIIRDADALLRFYQGDLLISVLVDVTVIIEAFRSRGFRAEFEHHSAWPITVVDQMNQDVPTLNVSDHFFNRIATEFLSLEWFTDELLARALHLRDPGAAHKEQAFTEEKEGGQV